MDQIPWKTHPRISSEEKTTPEPPVLRVKQSYRFVPTTTLWSIPIVLGDAKHGSELLGRSQQRLGYQLIAITAAGKLGPV